MEKWYSTGMHFDHMLLEQCCGSVTCWNGSGCGSGRPKNIRIRMRNTVTFTSFFKDKKSWSHKTVEIKVFFLFLLHDGRIHIWNRIRNCVDGSGCGSGRAKNIRILRIRIHNTVLEYAKLSSTYYSTYDRDKDPPTSRSTMLLPLTSWRLCSSSTCMQPRPFT